VLCALAAGLAISSTAACAGTFEQKGFVEGRLFLYPQLVPNDRAHAVSDVLLRYEPSFRFHNGLTLFASLDARTDSHGETNRDFTFAWWDRTARRPVFAVHRLSLLYRRKFLTVELGKQVVRWGKTDILNPTDRFAPKDYLTVVDTDYLPVTAARVSLERGSNTLDLVYVPRFTPSRMPLLDQRWVVLPAGVPGVSLRDAGARFPGGPQLGIRWNRIAPKLEYSFSYYEGYNHLPLLLPAFVPAAARVDVQRAYPKLRAGGADAAVPLRWFTLKAEAEMLSSSSPGADSYFLYVVQVERQWKEWMFIGGYAGDIVTDRGGAFQFAGDRGLARALIGRASVTIDANRSLSVEGVVRTNGQGIYLKPEYTQSFGQHWRVSAKFVGIRGSVTDFLGQYRRNSYGALVVRYSF
jgi:hypothetical protein